MVGTCGSTVILEGAVTAIEKLDLPGVGFVPTNVRYYPMGAIASHLLGGMQKDGIGLEGLELKFEKQLAGKDGFKRTLRDFRGRPLAVAAEDYIPPQHGHHLILTIDANIQLIAEQHVGRAGRGAEAAVHAGTQDFVGFRDVRIGELREGEGGLHGLWVYTNAPVVPAEP